MVKIVSRRRVGALSLWLILLAALCGAAGQAAARAPEVFAPRSGDPRVVLRVRGALTLGGYELNLALTSAGRPLCVSFAARGAEG